MTKKFEDIVNAPHRALGKKKKNVISKSGDDTPGQMAKFTALGIMQFVTWATKYLTLDNHLTRKLEKLFADVKKTDEKGQKKLWRVFVKSNPNFMGHVVYYMMMLATVAGVDLSKEDSFIKENFKEWVVDLTGDESSNDQKQIDKKIKEAQKGTYAAYLDKMKAVTPFLIANLIAMEGVKVNEQGLHYPYLCSKGVWTIGFGSTMLKDGSPVTKDTPPITTDEAYELARWHLEEGETYWGMYCYDVANKKVDVNTTAQAMGMGSVMYNAFSKLIEEPSSKNCRERFTLLRNDLKKYGFMLPDTLVEKRFREYPVEETRSFGKAWLGGESMKTVGDSLGNFLADGRGMRWRRWLESCLLNGDIKPEMLLECPADGMSQFWKSVGTRRENWFKNGKNGRETNRALVKEFEKWLKNPVDKDGFSIAQWKKTKDFLPDGVRAQCLAGKCELGKTIEKNEKGYDVERKTYVIGYEQMYAEAVSEVHKKNYEFALKKYEEIVKQYPDNALVHNDMAMVYNRLGQYENAIIHARHVLFDINDKSQYGAAQYNAGVAYEAMGNYKRALDNYKLAFANGNRRVKADIDRVTKIIVQKKTKKDAFKSGVNNMQQKRKKHLALNIEKDVNGLG